ncbi:ferrochelatase [Thermus thermamylovorans]|uniref:Ferrochelatase n=1 Tax=Thermus thermamylovorans TaxID=2509362 RepID=A0A4Q9B3H1_9DEIN|nr:ferrochelatase [Thermus thermamylovorans]TBH20084.1 ferrochelatase [Thermus thermamylovorans]
MNVLLMAYGTPYAPEEIEPYYTDIRRGKRPPEDLLHELSERYAAIGKSPLNEITLAQAIRLQALLNLEAPPYPRRLLGPFPPRAPQGPARVYVGTKHWHPTVGEAVAAMHEDGVRRAVAIVAAPHYSLRSVAEYREKVEAALKALPEPIDFAWVESYEAHPGLIAALARRLEEAIWRLKDPAKAAYVFTAHSIPVSAVERGDPYPHQVERTAELIARRLSLPRYSVAYQSAGRTPEPWLGPDINEHLRALREGGFEEVVVQAVGFPADHLEVYYDLDLEAQATAREVGLRLLRARSLNADPDYIQVLKELVEAAWLR